MLKWLDTLATAEKPAASNALISTSVQFGKTTFPVFPEIETPEIENREGWKPRGVWVSRFSRFSRLQNEGGREKHGANVLISLDAIPRNLPDLMAAIEPFADAEDRAYLSEQAESNPDHAAWYAWLLLLTPPAPTPEDLAELDGLIVRLCELWPWSKDKASKLLACRERMAPARVAEDLARFRSWVRHAEVERAAAVGRAEE
ncbi:hypothetical protein [Methylococcus sp. EFPC2]|uniref:hypothetical protein n=1 Tax=Methylococcus sp. EFPC2 TaxID=2812648 RepID=UPI001968335E|nr:hypothetical protein [Methylococcus sp. EFPC2]QSA97131.1 hypothetical protein JWZ97_18385 [Methylococcus sp. EFPC2]